MTTKITFPDLQFNGESETDAKLRRLLEEFRKVVRAINTLIEGGSSGPTPPVDVGIHVLADTAGLGPDHTTSGLTAGMVLEALSATTAAFRVLKFGDLDKTDIADTPANLDILQFIDGYWTNVEFPPVGEVNTAMNEGTGTGLFIGKIGAVLEFKSLAIGPNMTLVDDGETITLDSTGGGGSGYPAALGFAGVL